MERFKPSDKIGDNNMIKFAIDDVWTEDLRPKTLDEVIGNKPIIGLLKAHIKAGKIGHYLFSGDAGIGKTTTAICIAMAIWGDAWKGHFAEYNSGDADRGINMVRTDIKRTANQTNSKIIFIDEASEISLDAQEAFRRLMEKTSDTTRFIFSCNYSHKIIDPIKSRCDCLHFAPLTIPEMNQLTDKVSALKNIKASPEVRDILFRFAQGDARKIISKLQSTSILNPEISKETMQLLTQMPDKEMTKIMLVQAISGDFNSAREMLLSQYLQKGFDHEMMCDSILEVAQEIKFHDDKNQNDRILATINAIVANHAHFMTRASARIEFSGILAKISLIKDIKSVEQVIL